MQRSLARAQEVGNVRAEALCRHGLGAVRFLTGEWPAVEADLRAGVELAASVDSAFGMLLGEHRLAVLETATGRLGTAERRLHDALDTALASKELMVIEHSPTRLLAALAANRLAADDLDGALAAVERGTEASAAVAAGFGECVTCDVQLYPVTVAVRLRRGELDAAERACRRVEDSTTWFHSRAWIAAAHEVRGMLARATGDRTLAVDHLTRARDGFAALGQTYDEARCIWALASAVGGPEAADLARLARAQYNALGAMEPRPTADARRSD